METFFDRFPKFFSTSRAGGAERLRYRYELLFDHTAEIFPEMRVLDIGSHDGRWSFCALQHGASYVLGIEAYDSTVKAGVANYRHYGIKEDRYRFLVGDVFQTIRQLDPAVESERFDVGLCLGFLYHTTRHFEIVEQMQRLGCRVLLVETNVLQDEKDTKVKYRLEEVGPAHNAFSETGVKNSRTASALPSVSAVELLLKSFGYKSQLLALPPMPAPPTTGDDPLWDFRIGRRVALLARMD